MDMSRKRKNNKKKNRRENVIYELFGDQLMRMDASPLSLLFSDTVGTRLERYDDMNEMILQLNY